MNDTSPEIAKKICEMFQKKTPEERLMIGISMNTTSRKLVLRALKERNPDITPQELRQAFFLQFYRDDFSLEQREKILNHLAT